MLHKDEYPRIEDSSAMIQSSKDFQAALNIDAPLTSTVPVQGEEVTPVLALGKLNLAKFSITDDSPPRDDRSGKLPPKYIAKFGEFRNISDRVVFYPLLLKCCYHRF